MTSFSLSMRRDVVTLRRGDARGGINFVDPCPQIRRGAARSVGGLAAGSFRTVSDGQPMQ